MAQYRVVRKDNGPFNPHTGLVSQHRTLDAAQRAVDKANRSLRKQPGMATAWHPYEIQERDVDGVWMRARNEHVREPGSR